MDSLLQQRRESPDEPADVNHVVNEISGATELAPSIITMSVKCADL